MWTKSPYRAQKKFPLKTGQIPSTKHMDLGVKLFSRPDSIIRLTFKANMG